ncbi:P-loop containing nucleoside triphosphate hydrolase protein [Mytilinidion resinicola]|uniref:RNA helicase n=1 Tax=Mytilinidion resinicola TaxID=574789 RepID=A0A6A6Y5V3_9PEZI|nr:P-loop containing nucleoside triphosphate hydrolase protein [Mytilinidion resinicola]KAF2804172.1 P-loop containing nucleoside triphosphate hydrolase protein [Mytilinidion resinicola]
MLIWWQRLSVRPSTHAPLPRSRIEPLWYTRQRVLGRVIGRKLLTTQAAAVQQDILPPSTSSNESSGFIVRRVSRGNRAQGNEELNQDGAGRHKKAKRGGQKITAAKHKRAAAAAAAGATHGSLHQHHNHTHSNSATPIPSRRNARSKAASKRDQVAENMHSPPRKRARMGMVEDETMLPLPTPKDYPLAPTKLFSANLDTWQKATEGRIETDHQLNRLPKPDGGFEYSVTCRVYGSDFDPAVETAVGRDKNARKAEQIATRRLLGQLHAKGLLAELYLGDNAQPTKELGALSDVYNYCARTLDIPTIEIKHIPALNRRKRYVRVTIAHPSEDNICVHATRTSLKVALNAASVQFKRAAEQQHAAQGATPLIVRDSTALTEETAKPFMEFYKQTRRSYYEVRSERIVRYDGHQIDEAWKSQTYIAQEPAGEPAMSLGKKEASEALALLTAAVALSKQNPEVYEQFQKMKRTSTGKVLSPVRTVELDIPEDAEEVMRKAAREVRDNTIFSKDRPKMAQQAVEEADHRPRRSLDPSMNEARSAEMKEQLAAFNENPSLGPLRSKKENLPMNQYREKVLDLIENNTYSIVVGATGSGKTTQVPQILLEKSIEEGVGAQTNIICTQPRRIAATSVARRVADERNERLQESIGYQVRFDSKLPRHNGSVTYCTTGILLAQLQNSPDDILDTTSHIIIDEVHERDIIIDYLMITLKNLLETRRLENKFVPKVVLMSATLDTELFASYFRQHKEDGTVVPCPSLSVPGRTFPVKEKYLDDIMGELRLNYEAQGLNAVLNPDRVSQNYIETESKFSSTASTEDNLVAAAPIDWKRDAVNPGDTTQEDGMVPVGLVAASIAHLAQTTTEGAILAFLPGLDEIKKTRDLLTTQPLGVDFSDPARFKQYLLHSTIQGQDDVFAPVPPGCRKIILATNIAETSVTIPDVQYVVDTGKLKEKRYDQTTRITQLLTTWVSKSNSRQRAGRAGRVQNGNYYALYSQARFGAFRAIGLPEMLRSDLQEVCLGVMAQSIKTPVREFLAAAIEPPSAEAVDSSIVNLQALDAVTEDETLTPLGRVLASLPVHPSLGKMILMGILFRCFDPMLILSASSQGRSLFFSPIDNKKAADDARKVFASESNSDHIALINCFRIARQLRDQQGEFALQQFAQKYFMSIPTFLGIERTMGEIESILVQAGLIPFTDRRDRNRSQNGDPALNKNSGSIPLMKALILAGVHPNLGVAINPRLLQTPHEANTLIQPGSLNYMRGNRMGRSEGLVRGAMFAFSTMAKSADGNTIFLKDSSAVTPLMAAIFGSKTAMRDGRVLMIDDWLPLYIKRPGGFYSHSSNMVIEFFREALETVLGSAFSRIAKKGEGERYLADDPVLEKFADRFVDVLGRDVSGGEVFQRGEKREEPEFKIRGAAASMAEGRGRKRDSGRMN